MKKWLGILILATAWWCLHDLSGDAVTTSAKAQCPHSAETITDSRNKSKCDFDTQQFFATPSGNNFTCRENRTNALRTGHSWQKSEKRGFDDDGSQLTMRSLLRNTGVKMPFKVLSIIGKTSFPRVKDYYIYLLRKIII